VRRCGKTAQAGPFHGNLSFGAYRVEHTRSRDHAPFQGDGPVGAQGAVLTPERSLAVDHRFVPLGVPLWLSAQDKYRPVTLRRLVMAQDIGDGIEGPVRGDFFWGTGADAFRRGGDFYASGQYYLLLPKSIAGQRLAAR
jgi:membrane-bound lytic murein transglycosylase A